MAGPIKTSLAPIQASIANFQEMVDTLGRRVASVETTVDENFDALFRAEKAITELQTLNATLVDCIDDLENRSKRVNLRIINVPEDSETTGDSDMVTFVSTLLKDTMGNLFTTPPELDRAHWALAQKPRPIIVAFHRYQDRECALRWARQNDVIYEGN